MCTFQTYVTGSKRGNEGKAASCALMRTFMDTPSRVGDYGMALAGWLPSSNMEEERTLEDILII